MNYIYILFVSETSYFYFNLYLGGKKLGYLFVTGQVIILLCGVRLQKFIVFM